MVGGKAAIRNWSQRGVEWCTKNLFVGALVNSKLPRLHGCPKCECKTPTFFKSSPSGSETFTLEVNGVRFQIASHFFKSHYHLENSWRVFADRLPGNPSKACVTKALDLHKDCGHVHKKGGLSVSSDTHTHTYHIVQRVVPS